MSAGKCQSLFLEFTTIFAMYRPVVATRGTLPGFEAAVPEEKTNEAAASGEILLAWNDAGLKTVPPSRA